MSWQAVRKGAVESYDVYAKDKGSAVEELGNIDPAVQGGHIARRASGLELTSAFRWDMLSHNIGTAVDM